MEFWTYSQDGIAYPQYLKLEIEGIQCYADYVDAGKLGELATVTGKLVEGEKPIYRPLTVAIPDEDMVNDIRIHVTERTDALKLAKAISRRDPGGAAFVWAGSRSLAVCRHGGVAARRTLDDFFIDVTAEELAETALD